MEKKDYRVNEGIVAKKVRVVGQEGEQLGVMTISKALEEAENCSLDLIEVAPNAKPPVCRILDYGKMKYELRKKIKKNSQVVKSKTVKIKHNIEIFDLDRKIKDIQKFINKDFSVSIQMRLKGRARNFLDKAFSIIEYIKDSVENAQFKSPKNKSGQEVNGEDGHFKLEITPCKKTVKNS